MNAVVVVVSASAMSSILDASGVCECSGVCAHGAMTVNTSRANW